MTTETEPVTCHFGCYLADLGPTPATGIVAWVAQFRELIHQTSPLAVVNQTRVGRNGRVFIEIVAPDPDQAVCAARALADGEGPEVLPL
jgi:hypothetical protein